MFMIFWMEECMDEWMDGSNRSRVLGLALPTYMTWWTLRATIPAFSVIRRDAPVFLAVVLVVLLSGRP